MPRGRHRLAPPPRGQHRLEPWLRGRHRLAHTLLLAGDTAWSPGLAGGTAWHKPSRLAGSTACPPRRALLGTSRPPNAASRSMRKKARRRGHSDEAQEGRLRRGRIYTRRIAGTIPGKSAGRSSARKTQGNCGQRRGQPPRQCGSSRARARHRGPALGGTRRPTRAAAPRAISDSLAGAPCPIPDPRVGCVSRCGRPSCSLGGG